MQHAVDTKVHTNGLHENFYIIPFCITQRDMFDCCTCSFTIVSMHIINFQQGKCNIYLFYSYAFPSSCSMLNRLFSHLI